MTPRPRRKSLQNVLEALGAKSLFKSFNRCNSRHLTSCQHKRGAALALHDANVVVRCFEKLYISSTQQLRSQKSRISPVSLWSFRYQFICFVIADKEVD